MPFFQIIISISIEFPYVVFYKITSMPCNHVEAAFVILRIFWSAGGAIWADVNNMFDKLSWIATVEGSFIFQFPLRQRYITSSSFFCPDTI